MLGSRSLAVPNLAGFAAPALSSPVARSRAEDPRSCHDKRSAMISTGSMRPSHARVHRVRDVHTAKCDHRCTRSLHVPMRFHHHKCRIDKSTAKEVHRYTTYCRPPAAGERPTLSSRPSECRLVCVTFSDEERRGSPVETPTPCLHRRRTQRRS